MMTIAAVKAMNTPTIDPAVAAAVLGCNPNSIRQAARQRPELLGFPVIIMGTRIRIPRIPFIQALEGRGAND